MILQALCELAHHEGLVKDPDYEIKPVRWLITVRSSGETVGPVRCTDDEEGHPARFRVPRQPKRTSGVKPFFFCDNAQYVLCSAKDKLDAKPDRVRQCFEAFRETVARCAQKTNADPGAQGVSEFLTRLSADPGCFSMPEDLRSNDNIAFVLDSDLVTLVTERPAIDAHWRRIRAEQGSSPVTCLVSGKQGARAGVHPPIKKLPGKKPETALISFEEPAFWSYGWTKHENAAISRESSEAFSTAMNRLLDPAPPKPADPTQRLPRRNLHLSGETVACYWASGSSADPFLDVLESLVKANEESVPELYRSIWRGVPVRINDPSRFYAFTVSSAAARVVVRDWLESTVAKVAHNLATHFADLSIARITPPSAKSPLPPSFPLRQLAEFLCPEGKGNPVPPPLVTQLFESAINGAPYRFAVLQRAIERTRAEITNDDWNGRIRLDARAALIKAFLNRWKRAHPHTTHYQEILTVLDPTNASPGYLLGQLMAVIEHAQERAMDANATVVDRYFKGASAAPRSVFVRLLKNSQHHIRKLQESRPGTAVLLKRLMDYIVAGFNPNDNGFPARLSIEQQGLFVLGYHQMRGWLRFSAEERASWETRFPTLPAAYKWSKEATTESN